MTANFVRLRNQALVVGTTVVLILIGIAVLRPSPSSDPGTSPPQELAIGESARFNDRATDTLPKLSISEPLDAAEVSSPFLMAVDLSGLTATTAGETRDGYGHLHLIVNKPCLAAGSVIPKDANHVHWGDGAVEAFVELPAGEHTICAQVGDGFHAAVAVTESITITVTE